MHTVNKISGNFHSRLGSHAHPLEIQRLACEVCHSPIARAASARTFASAAAPKSLASPPSLRAGGFPGMGCSEFGVVGGVSLGTEAISGHRKFIQLILEDSCSDIQPGGSQP